MLLHRQEGCEFYSDFGVLLRVQVAVNDGVALWIWWVYYCACNVVLPVNLSGYPFDAATRIAHPSASRYKIARQGSLIGHWKRSGTYQQRRLCLVASPHWAFFFLFYGLGVREVPLESLLITPATLRADYQSLHQRDVLVNEAARAFLLFSCLKFS